MHREQLPPSPRQGHKKGRTGISDPDAEEHKVRGQEAKEEDRRSKTSPEGSLAQTEDQRGGRVNPVPPLHAGV